jgi:hypothetical protein
MTRPEDDGDEMKWELRGKEGKKGIGEWRTGSLSHALGSVPCVCSVPHPVRAYSVKRNVREDSIMIVI